jgi:SAM-dependent methyltransferase
MLLDFARKAFFYISYWGKLIRLLNSEATSVLDLGCGCGRPLSVIKRFHPIKYVVGLDLLPRSVKHAKRTGLYDDLIVADLRYLPVRNKIFDVVLVLDVIEHLSKKEGNDLLNTLDELSKKETIIHTPNGFMPTSTSEPFDMHRSGWSLSDFTKRGYKVFGDSGFKLPARLKRVNLLEDLIKLRIEFLVGLLDYFFGEILGYRNPRFAYQFLCIKKHSIQ